MCVVLVQLTVLSLLVRFFCRTRLRACIIHNTSLPCRKLESDCVICYSIIWIQLMLSDSVGEVFILYFSLVSILYCGWLMWWKLLFNCFAFTRDWRKYSKRNWNYVRKHIAIKKCPTLSSCYTYWKSVWLTTTHTPIFQCSKILEKLRAVDEGNPCLLKCLIKAPIGSRLNFWPCYRFLLNTGKDYHSAV